MPRSACLFMTHSAHSSATLGLCPLPAPPPTHTYPFSCARTHARTHAHRASSNSLCILTRLPVPIPARSPAQVVVGHQTTDVRGAPAQHGLRPAALSSAYARVFLHNNHVHALTKDGEVRHRRLSAFLPYLSTTTDCFHFGILTILLRER